MYRGEVSIEEEKLEPLMRAAQTLQIHGLSACLKACLQRSGKIEENQVRKCLELESVHLPNQHIFLLDLVYLVGPLTPIFLQSKVKPLF